MHPQQKEVFLLKCRIYACDYALYKSGLIQFNDLVISANRLLDSSGLNIERIEADVDLLTKPLKEIL